MNRFWNMRNTMSSLATTTLVLTALLCWGSRPADVLAGPPLYEPAYVNGRTVTISVQAPPGKVAHKALGVYFEVIYPIGWEFLTDSTPLCNPCDHGGDGLDFYDYHDHVFSGEPGNPKDGTYRPLWQLSFVVPAYTGNTDHDLAVSVAYAAYLPVKSAAQVKGLLEATLDDGSPIANWSVVDVFFLAAIVNDKARR